MLLYFTKDRSKMDFKLEETFNMVSLDYKVSKKSLRDIKLFENVFDIDIADFETEKIEPVVNQNETPIKYLPKKLGRNQRATRRNQQPVDNNDIPKVTQEINEASTEQEEANQVTVKKDKVKRKKNKKKEVDQVSTEQEEVNQVTIEKNEVKREVLIEHHKINIESSSSN